MNAAIFAARLGRLLRERRGARTQLEVAAAAGISDSTLSNYERGEVVPSITTMFSLLDILGITAADIFELLGGGDEPNGNPVAA